MFPILERIIRSLKHWISLNHQLLRNNFIHSSPLNMIPISVVWLMAFLSAHVITSMTKIGKGLRIKLTEGTNYTLSFNNL